MFLFEDNIKANNEKVRKALESLAKATILEPSHVWAIFGVFLAVFLVALWAPGLKYDFIVKLLISLLTATVGVFYCVLRIKSDEIRKAYEEISGLNINSEILETYRTAHQDMKENLIKSESKAEILESFLLLLLPKRDEEEKNNE